MALGGILVHQGKRARKHGDKEMLFLIVTRILKYLGINAAGIIGCCYRTAQKAGAGGALRRDHASRVPKLTRGLAVRKTRNLKKLCGFQNVLAPK